MRTEDAEQRPAATGVEDPAAVGVRNQLVVAAAAVAVGVAVVGTGPSDVGMWISLAGGVGLIASIHRLGRLGPPGLPGAPAAKDVARAGVDTSG